MIFITRCTNCHSIFRLTVTQLRAQDGRVRCGQCRSIFNALLTLSIAADTQIASITPLVSIEQDGHPTAVTTKVPSHNEEGFDFLDSPATQQPSSHKLRKASYILLALLAWQIMHGYRGELVMAFPAWRAFFENYCAVMRCDMPLPQQLALLSIESSELKFNPVDATDEIGLTAIIRNHAPFSQELPTLLFSLTDVNDRVIASQILHPRDYLPPEALDAIKTGFSANHEILIQRQFRLNAVKAIGYRLELRYP